MTREESVSRHDWRETAAAERAPGSKDSGLAAEDLSEEDTSEDLGQQSAITDANGASESSPEMAKIRAERDEYLDTSRRIQAEFENYRKRIAREQAESVARGTASLIERLLPILDALDLALAHIGDGDRSDDDARSALIQVESLARSTLEREGLARIDEAGVLFDPTIHDAVSHVARDNEDGPEPSVVDEVLRAGYTLKGKVIRPAMVTVKG